MNTPERKKPNFNFINFETNLKNKKHKKYTKSYSSLDIKTFDLDIFKTHEKTIKVLSRERKEITDFSLFL